MFLKSAFRQFSCQSLPELDVPQTRSSFSAFAFTVTHIVKVIGKGAPSTLPIPSPSHPCSRRREWCHSIWFFISFQKMLVLLTFNKGNMVFHFEWGFPVKNLKHMNHLKTLTMVSMQTKVVSRDSFLDKLSEKVYLNGF